MFAQNPYGDLRPGVADGYSLSHPHGDLRGRDFPAVRDGESTDTVVIDGDVLGGNAALLFSVVHVDMVDQLRHHALGALGGVGVPPDSFKECVNVHPLTLCPFIFRHFSRTAHQRFNELILVFVGETGQPVHFVQQHHLLRKLQPDVMGLGALAQAGIVLLATEKLVALVEVEIEVAAAFRAFQITGKHAGLLGDSGPPPAGPLFHILHLFPGCPVYNGLMDVEKDRPVLLRVFDPLFHLVGLGIGFEVDHVPAILLRGQDFCGSRKAAVKAGCRNFLSTCLQFCTFGKYPAHSIRSYCSFCREKRYT